MFISSHLLKRKIVELNAKIVPITSTKKHSLQSVLSHSIHLFVTATTGAYATWRGRLLPFYVIPVWWTKVLFKWQAVFATKIHELDMFDVLTKVDSWTLRINAAPCAIKISHQMLRNIFNSVLNTRCFHCTSRQLQQRRWIKWEIPDKANYKRVFPQA